MNTNRARNLVDQMKAVVVMNRLRPISATAFALWFQINMKWNAVKWTNAPIPISLAHIAQDISTSRQNAYKAAQSLIDKGYIAIRKGRNAKTLPQVYICYLPQYIDKIALGHQSAFDRLQDLINQGESDSTIAENLSTDADAKASIDEIKKRLSNNFFS